MRVRRAVRSLAAALVVAVAVAEVSCSLGLDASLIDAGGGDDGTAPTVEGGADVSAQHDADAHSVPTDAPLTIDAGACTRDSDCQTAAEAGAGCVTAAKCDPTWHVCMLTTCAQTGCKAAVCNLSLQSCSVPTTYGFAAAKFPVSYGGVGAGVRNSISAAWPFVFVVTTNGVVAYDVVDPSSTSPPLVTVHGVPFIPIATIAVGRRVYFVGGTQGGGPTYRQPVAWVDVPQNPLLTDLYAVSAFVGTAQTGVANVVTNGADGMFVIYSSGNQYPAANVHPPLDETTTLASFPNAGLASNATLPAASGSRLIAYRYDGPSNTPYLAIVNSAATAGAQTTTEQAISAYGALANQSQLGTGGDGSLLWTTAIDDVPDGGSPDGVALARLTWLLGSGTAANFDTTVHVDLQSYSPPASANVVGPPLWIDPNTVLGLAAASSGSTDSTSVQLVTKSPPAVVAGTRTLLSIAPGSVGVAASGGFGYLLAQDDTNNKSCSVYIFAPACGTADH
jgi:hypothetical protein